MSDPVQPSPAPSIAIGGRMPAVMHRVHLTFDDGSGLSTPDLLEVPATRAIGATFFVLGRNVEAHPEIVRRIAARGHVLGNHTYSHARPDAFSSDDLVAEIERTR